MKIQQRAIVRHVVVALGLVAVLASTAEAEEETCPCFEAKVLESKCVTEGPNMPRLFISQGSDGQVQFNCYNEYAQELMINLYDPQKNRTRGSDESLPLWQRQAPSCKYEFGYRENKTVTMMVQKEFTVCMNELKTAIRSMKLDCSFDEGGGRCSPLGP